MALRLLHTADWHLGRALHEASLLDEQAWALERLLEVARAERPDLLVVAGDVFDRAVPPAEAVKLLDEVLTRLADLGVPVVVIAGNHDSADRLTFGARLLAARGVHLRGALTGVERPIELPGRGFVYALPFVDPEVVRGLTGDEAVRGQVAATERLLAPARSDAAGRALPTVLVAHAFVQGAAETQDSERPITVGGAGAVPAEAFAGFDYVALGHLHAPQAVAPALHYAGSLLKYSFAEADHRKAALLVEVERGVARVRPIHLGQRRDVVRLRGTLAELLARPDLEPHRDDWVEAFLDDEGYVVDARRRLEARFHHVLNVRRRELAAGGEGTFARTVGAAGRDDLALFQAFCERVAGGPPTGPQRACFVEAVEAVDRAERGA